jgi:hypothetical protein
MKNNESKNTDNFVLLGGGGGGGGGGILDTVGILLPE